MTPDPRERIDVPGTAVHIAKRGAQALVDAYDNANPGGSLGYAVAALAALAIPALVAGASGSPGPVAGPYRASNDPPFNSHDVSGADVAGGAIAAAAFGAAMGAARGGARAVAGVSPVVLFGVGVAGIAAGYALALIVRPTPPALARKEPPPDAHL